MSPLINVSCEQEKLLGRQARIRTSLSKPWNAVSYHPCPEAVAAGYVRFEHIPGDQNPANILTTPLPRYKAKVYTDPILFNYPGLDSFRVEESSRKSSGFV